MDVLYAAKPRAKHGYQHPDQNIFGVLLGRKSDNNVNVTRAIPLYHGRVFLNLYIEMGLTMVEEHAKSQDEQIVGSYFLSESGAAAIPSTVSPFCEVIKTQFPQAITLTLDSEKSYSSSSSHLVMRGYQHDKSTKEIPQNQISYKGEAPVTSMIERAETADFLDHMEDTNKPWLL
ncbi:hypothetical protein PROFUN_05924 [Planoprotostelium fungivorum]|uniref:MPN domain-containing protein n=1 Tax=Planoprotostelium fungivorum TaxID=1890364 RepID=A0A2P6N7L9_9EUKA|nr:hypothetical protein PROFUN_05924 [Planoprotostelium fungivorum]